MESQWIRSTTADTFNQDVIEQSMSCPAVVDFWAEWCQPCKQLMPLLEKMAVEFDGRFVLMKINVDEQPQLAGAFGVQSIPFVVAMVDGQPVSQLPGVQPEPQLRQWIESFVPSPAVEAYNAGLAAEGEADINKAEERFRIAATLEPDAAPFQIALARVLIQLDRDNEGQEIIDQLETRGFLEPEAEALKEQIAMKASVEDSGGIVTARADLEADPGNLTLQIHLAEALSTEKRYAEACDILLDIVNKDRSEIRDKAKEAMVVILGAMGPKSRQAADYRRKLTTAFY